MANSRCLTPIPPLPPSDVRTRTTCSSVEVGNGAGGPPSLCACPDNLLFYTENNISYFFDYQWANNPVSVNIYTYLIALQVNAEGKQYNQKFIHNTGECPERSAPNGERLEIEVNNLATDRRVTCTKYSNTGAVQRVYFNYDATAEFSPGDPRWVIIVSGEAGANRHLIRAFIDSTQIGQDDEYSQYLSSFMELRRSGSIPGQLIPFGLWQYSQSLEQCLTSGNFNGFGGCSVITQNDFLRWDRGQTDPDIDLIIDDRVAMAKDGLATRRSAYLITPSMNGRVYWEVARSPNAGCLASDFSCGAVQRGLDLGTNYTGEVAGSWGVLAPSGTLYAEGTNLFSGYIMNGRRYLFCYDNNTRELWLGREVSTGNTSWVGGGTPGSGATSFVLFSEKKDLQLAFSPKEFPEPQYIVSSAKSCRYAPPPTFDYLS